MLRTLVACDNKLNNEHQNPHNQPITLLLFSTAAFPQNWNEVMKAVASDRGAGDWFGHSVSISGNYAIVGAIQIDFKIAPADTASVEVAYFGEV